MKKVLFSVLAGVIALPMLGASFVEQAEAKPMWHKVCKPIVGAVGRAGGVLPYRIKKRRALRRARSKWRQKVFARYGYRYIRWSIARHKRVRCEGAAGSVYCKVRARPCKRIFRRGFRANR